MDEQEPPKKLKKLTPLQKQIARARVRYPDETQREIGNRLGITQPHVAKELAKPHVKANIRDMMDENPKLTTPALLRKLEEGLDAGDGEQASDYAVRHKYLETGLKLRGELRNDAPITNIALFTPEVLDALIAARNAK